MARKLQTIQKNTYKTGVLCPRRGRIDEEQDAPPRQRHKGIRSDRVCPQQPFFWMLCFCIVVHIVIFVDINTCSFLLKNRNQVINFSYKGFPEGVTATAQGLQIHSQ